MIPPYQLLRSARKTLSLEITRDGRLVVRAPLRTTQRQIDEFIANHEAWITSGLEKQRRRREARPEPSDQGREALVRLAMERLPGRVAHFAAIMGLYPAGITITGARTRFGSCSGKNRICFSWRLMQYPEEAVDYVVVHELAHIRHKNHSPAFYACVEQVLPDWRERRQMLKD